MKLLIKVALTVICPVILACTKNTPGSMTAYPEGYPVTFDISIEGTPLTRGSRLDASGIDKYGVFGILGKKVFASNVVFQRNADGTWSQDKPLTTPEGNVNFYAVNASFAKISAGGVMDKLTMNSSRQTFTYTVPESSEDQFDLMYSSSIGVNVYENGGRTGLSFRPALSALNFTIINKMEEDCTVTVGGISVYNMIDSGTFTFDATTSNTGTWKEGTTRGKMVRIFDEPFEVSRTKQYLVDKDTLFLVIPQPKTTKWKTKDTSPVSTLEADMEGHVYIKLLCKIKNANGHYVLGSDSTYGDVYLPANILKTTEGKTVTYSITFSGGYDSEGQPMSFGSGFDIDVDPWTYGNDTPEDMEF
ncbi:MAG: fimbrillin family protein [Bacteroidales bacterium]|nr:fimbrillin family protein [Bacteroidales bacterium]MBQ2109136.1 fimbrillin family protein [Bacteroidales bacterium]MBQ2527058.1 fimbrillin family protein [Bacteroidales bacterium]MBQ5528281.1 fimbrillin family protein [Bacteroidales bacterium]MEE3407428.1 fimbrillin family protein [Candidatus Cryptobacteroides sp.]